MCIERQLILVVIQRKEKQRGDLFVVGRPDTKLLQPRYLGNTERSHRIPDSDRLDRDELIRILVDACEAQLFQPEAVLAIRRRALGLVPERDIWEGVFVVILLPVLHILEDGIEMFNAFSSQKSQFANHTGHRSCRKCAAGEPNEDDFIAIHKVGAKIKIDFSDTLRIGQRCHVTKMHIYQLCSHSYSCNPQ